MNYKITLILFIVFVQFANISVGQLQVKHKLLDVSRKEYVQNLKSIEDSSYIGVVWTKDWSNDVLTSILIVKFDKDLKRLNHIDALKLISKNDVSILDSRISEDKVSLLYRFSNLDSNNNNIGLFEYSLSEDSLLIDMKIFVGETLTSLDRYKTKYFNESLSFGKITDQNALVIGCPVFKTDRGNDFSSVQINLYFKKIQFNKGKLIELESGSTLLNFNEKHTLISKKVNDFGGLELLVRNEEDYGLKYVKFGDNQLFMTNVGEYGKATKIFTDKKNKSRLLLLSRKVGGQLVLKEVILDSKKRSKQLMNDYIVHESRKAPDVYRGYYEILEDKKSYVVKEPVFYRKKQLNEHPTIKSEKSMVYRSGFGIYSIDKKKRSHTYEERLPVVRYPITPIPLPVIKLRDKKYQLSLIHYDQGCYSGDIANCKIKDTLTYIIYDLDNSKFSSEIKTDHIVDYSEIDPKSMIKVNDRSFLFKSLSYKIIPGEKDIKKKAFKRYELIEIEE